MIIHDVIQGSDEWAMLRAGIPTASAFKRILTPGGVDHKKPAASKSSEPYMFELLAERMIGRPLKEFSTSWMDRGSKLEIDAVMSYELEHDCDTVKVGFITTDDGRIGASPDRLVGERGMLETKCPMPQTHISYLVAMEPNYKIRALSVDGEYYPQLQGQLWIAEREWIDILSYHPEMPPAFVRVPRDENYIRQLEATVRAFSDALEEIAADWTARGWMKPIRFVESMAR